MVEEYVELLAVREDDEGLQEGQEGLLVPPAGRHHGRGVALLVGAQALLDEVVPVLQAV